LKINNRSIILCGRARKRFAASRLVAGNREDAVTEGPGALTSIDVARLLLKAAARAGVDTRLLAADAGLPAWALSAGPGMIPARLTTRLLELLEYALADPQAGLTVAGGRAPGDFGLYDYLISTSATLRAGLTAASRYLHLVTTSGRLEVIDDGGQFTTYSCRCLEAGDRGEELCLQFAVGALCAGARAATAQRVVPVRVTFSQQRPRSSSAFAEVLGTSRIDFGAPAATFTFRARDLDLPLPTADPALAEILARYAATFPAPPPTTWWERFRQLVDEALVVDSPSLAEIARHLAISTRTLQRRLADHGTTWRAELDGARQRRAASARLESGPDIARLARQLGYADPRSARRALRRWDSEG
jgi:AraC-like DNA-binding protein